MLGAGGVVQLAVRIADQLRGSCRTADRGLGNGIFNSGAAVGAVVAPILVPAITAAFGWRWAFASVGALGFAWVAIWSRLRPAGARTWAGDQDDSDPSPPAIDRRWAFVVADRRGLGRRCWVRSDSGSECPLVGDGRLDVRDAGGGGRVLRRGPTGSSRWMAALATIARSRRFWVMVAVSASINVCWHFLVNWMASFLQIDRKLGLGRGGNPRPCRSWRPTRGTSSGASCRGPGSGRACAVRGPDEGHRVGALLVSCGDDGRRLEHAAAIVALLAVMSLGMPRSSCPTTSLCQDVSPRHTGLGRGGLGRDGEFVRGRFLADRGPDEGQLGEFRERFRDRRPDPDGRRRSFCGGAGGARWSRGGSELDSEGGMCHDRRPPWRRASVGARMVR